METRKIESCIAQRKLLGLKSVQYDAINRGRLKKKSKAKDNFRQKSRPQSGIRDCKYCGNNQCRQYPAYGKECKSCGKKNHFAKKCQSRSQSQPSGKRSFKYRQINVDHEASSDDGQ